MLLDSGLHQSRRLFLSHGRNARLQLQLAKARCNLQFAIRLCGVGEMLSGCFEQTAPNWPGVLTRQGMQLSGVSLEIKKVLGRIPEVEYNFVAILTQ